MTEQFFADILSFDTPARDQIRVQGRIKESWCDRLEGMAIQIDAPGDGQTICTLEGELQDQAALIGVVTTLYELHLPVLSVQCLNSKAAGI